MKLSSKIKVYIFCHRPISFELCCRKYIFQVSKIYVIRKKKRCVSVDKTSNADIGNKSFNLGENVIKMCFHASAAFKWIFTHFFKVLPINARGLNKISVRANVPDEGNLITIICLSCWGVHCASPDKSTDWKSRSRELKTNYNIGTCISAFYDHFFYSHLIKVWVVNCN